MTHSIGLAADIVAYINKHNPPEHPVMRRCREDIEAKYPTFAWFQVSTEQASFLSMLTRLVQANRILEVGTFNGYSAMAFALAANEIPARQTHVATFELNSEWADNARRYFTDAGVESCIEVVVGDAVSTLPTYVNGHAGTFDLCFVDADKKNTWVYVEECYRALRPGGLILVDNILWDAKVIAEGALDQDTAALKQCAELAQRDHRFHSIICSVGDGLLMMLKN